MIYLDNAATTRPFDSVIEGMAQAQRETYWNPSAAYRDAVELDRRIDSVRARMGGALGNRNAHVVFTAGATEANNMALRGAPRGRVLISAMEHPSVANTAALLQKQGWELTVLPVDAQGQLDLAALEAALDERVSLVSVMLVNNETGALQKPGSISRLIRQKSPRALFHVDAVQGFLRSPLSLTEDGVDLISLSGHKINGPKGVGALVAAPEVPLCPLLEGGGQENGLRSGTVNGPALLGLGIAVQEYLDHPQWPEDIMKLKLLFYDGLREMDGVTVNGPNPREAAPHILNLSFEGTRGEVLLHAMEEEGIMVSTGSACSSHSIRVSPVLLAQGVSRQRAEQAIRFSLSPLTTRQDIDQALEIIPAVVKRLRHFKRR